MTTGVARPGEIVMVFPGQGSQWAGMGAALLESSEVFAAAVAECEAALAPYVDWSLPAVLRGEGDLERVDVVQPALFAVMVALARMWESAGIRPDVVVGHSQGEIAAAYVAGALSLDDAARVVALRSKAVLELAGAGAMAQLALGEAETRELLRPWGEEAVVAAVNGPSATVVSGTPGAVEDVLARAEARGVRGRRIPVNYASHSPQVRRLGDRLLADLAGIAPRTSSAVFHSTVTGGPWTPAAWTRTTGTATSANRCGSPRSSPRSPRRRRCSSR
ncbi:acyltransferase domain-containing protein [Thermocatellispora tengchongensis]|uniref:acyltransferase domain-containing protein n=1 Tax=Thermocatellispora tengchongensis TaxID=1073253 RepID=UPI00363ABB5A